MNFLADVLTLCLLVGALVAALAALDLISRTPELLAKAYISARDRRDRRRQATQWTPGGYRVKGIRRA